MEDNKQLKNTTIHFVVFEEEIKKIKELAIADTRDGVLTNINIGYHEDTYCSWFPYAITHQKNMKISLNPYVNKEHYHVLMTFPYKKNKRRKKGEYGEKHYWKNLPDSNDADCPKIIRKFRKIASKRIKKYRSKCKKHIGIINNNDINKIYNALYKSCRTICSIP